MSFEFHEFHIQNKGFREKNIQTKKFSIKITGKNRANSDQMVVCYT